MPSGIVYILLGDVYSLLNKSFRVRRGEVQSASSSRSPSPVDESVIQDAHARLGELLNLDDIIGANAASQETDEPSRPPGAGPGEDEEQEFEFRLFNAPVKSKDKTTSSQPESGTDNASTTKTKDLASGTQNGGTQKLRIRLRSPTPTTNPSEGRFLKASRGWQYYFSTPSLFGIEAESEHSEQQAERRRQFEDMAVSGKHLTTWAQSQRWVSHTYSFDSLKWKTLYWTFTDSIIARMPSSMASRPSQTPANKAAPQIHRRPSLRG